jgi:hypothetical protein
LENLTHGYRINGEWRGNPRWSTRSLGPYRRSNGDGWRCKRGGQPNLLGNLLREPKRERRRRWDRGTTKEKVPRRRRREGVFPSLS